jgi:hypothetical protein
VTEIASWRPRRIGPEYSEPSIASKGRYDRHRISLAIDIAVTCRFLDEAVKPIGRYHPDRERVKATSSDDDGRKQWETTPVRSSHADRRSVSATELLVPLMLFLA